MTSDDAAFRDLSRELYWAEDATRRGGMSTGDVRNELHDLAALLRADERLRIPAGEANLASSSPWRRRLKLGLFRLFRPISWRYDRLLADHAELTTVLAERVQRLEAEVSSLRDQLGGQTTDGDPPERGGSR
ncbi:MAG TPA: hypothetical protein VH989_00815 [Actinomycetota bacterium]|jgi:hypothetical protein